MLSELKCENANICLLKVDLGADSENTSTKEFKKFKDILFANVEKANDIRIKRHFG